MHALDPYVSPRRQPDRLEPRAETHRHTFCWLDRGKTRRTLNFVFIHVLGRGNQPHLGIVRALIGDNRAQFFFQRLVRAHSRVTSAPRHLRQQGCSSFRHFKVYVRGQYPTSLTSTRLLRLLKDNVVVVVLTTSDDGNGLSSGPSHTQSLFPKVIVGSTSRLNSFPSHIDHTYRSTVILPKLASHTLAKSFLPLSHAVSYALPLSPLRRPESVILVRGGGGYTTRFLVLAISYIRKRAVVSSRLGSLTDVGIRSNIKRYGYHPMDTRGGLPGHPSQRAHPYAKSDSFPQPTKR